MVPRATALGGDPRGSAPWWGPGRSPASRAMMLEVEDLHAFYGKSHILQGVSLSVGDGEIVSLLGRNGVGRSTTCKAIMGLVDPIGTVRFRGQDIAGLKSNLVARAGI